MSTTLKVLSYNIHKGFRVASKRFVLHEIRELLRSIEVDIVFLQEVIGEHTRHATAIEQWPATSQYEFLADEVWSDFSYGKNAVYEHGHHGNAILSRFPIQRWENLNISTSTYERRGLLFAESVIPKTTASIHVACTHLDLTQTGRISQVTQITDWIKQNVPTNAPLILAGDFNDWANRASAPLERDLGIVEVIKSSQGKLQATFPSVWPLFPLDRIYVRGFQRITASVLKEKVWRTLSDHLPVYAELML